MAPPFHFPNNPKAFPQDIWRTKDVDGLLIMLMLVVCLSFLSIFTVPIGLEKEHGFAGAREAMHSVGFSIFVVMNTVSFFSSLGVVSVLVLLQVMAMDNTSQSVIKRVVRMCGVVAQIAMGSAAIAFVSAATTFTRHL